jgi:hypothetical protein
LPGASACRSVEQRRSIKSVDQNILGVAELPCVAAADRANVSAMHDLFTVPLTKTP